ncbi:MAG: PDZ domain-containing protein [Pyrinomonadaceae bacterium]|nr:PDZ domain-containing protein [Pyrinomonadaceae bacterium]
MQFKKVLFVILFIFCNLIAFGQVATLDDSALQVRQRTFDRVWSIVNESHFDTNFNGVDWKKVGESYRPQAMSANSDSEFYNILNQMIGELNQSHFSIYTKDSEAELSKCNEGVIGVDLRLLDDHAVINRVEANSPADKAGIKMGFEITKIDDRTLPELLLSLENTLAPRKFADGVKQAFRERVLTRALCGKPETSVKIEVLDKKNTAKTLNLTRTAYKGEILKVAEGIPPFKPLFEAKWLENKIAYISFNVWIPKQADRVQAAIRSMRDARGIIIDLRNNAGGQGNLVNNVGGTMFSERVSFGKTKRRNGEGDFWVLPQDEIYSGKVVILTNCGTGSTSEIFAAGMKDLGRATLIGERTAGAVLPANVERLPSGANFLHAVADYRSPSGILIEGKGIEPNVEVRLTRQTLLEGRDLQLEAGIRELLR